FRSRAADRPGDQEPSSRFARRRKGAGGRLPSGGLLRRLVAPPAEAENGLNNVEQFGFEFGFDAAPVRRVFTVSELNSAIRGVLDGEFNDIRVTGEISGLKLATSGHYYFTLKERDAQILAVAFRSAHRYWKFKPQDGMAVLARGRIDVYEARGEYQL